METGLHPSGQMLLHGVALLCLHLSLLMGKHGYSSKHMEHLLKHYTKGVAAISMSIVSWLIVGHGVSNNSGPPFFGSDAVFASGLDPSSSPAALTQAVILGLVATIVTGAVSEGVTLRASLLLTATITGVVVPISARTIWHPNGIFTAEGNTWSFIANGVGVIDAGGGGIIHCTAGAIALALCLVASPAYPTAGNLDSISDPTGSNLLGQLVQGTGLFWAGFTLVHGTTVSDAYSSRHSLPEMAAVATLFSGCIGCLTAVLQTCWRRRSWNYKEVASAWARALRVSVVTSAASCTVVPLWSHLLTAPLAVIIARKVHRLLNRISVSEASGVVAVHLVGGVCSMVSVGLFARSDLLLSLPLMPSDAATQWSEGIVFGGSGHQLAAQLMWITFNLMWSLLLVVPFACILRSLGVLIHDPELHVTAAMNEAKRDVIKAAWTQCKDTLNWVIERIRGFCSKKGNVPTSTVSLYHLSGATAHAPGNVHASFSTSVGSQDWRPLKAHAAMHEAIKIFQQCEEGAYAPQRENVNADATHADVRGPHQSEIQHWQPHQSAINVAALLGRMHPSATSTQCTGASLSEVDGCGLSASHRQHSFPGAPILSGRTVSTGANVLSGVGTQAKTSSGTKYSGVLSPLTAALMMANDVTYKSKSSIAELDG